jgi:tetratricopeptide (TPR) repeat protein
MLSSIGLRGILNFLSFSFLILTMSAGLAISGEKDQHPNFVSSDKCISCHLEQQNLWENSDHSWAWRPATDHNVLGDFKNVSFKHNSIKTRFVTSNGKFWIETDNEKGELEKHEIKYVVGIQPLQQYLIELDGGRLQVLDIAWDTKRNKWFMVFPDQTDNIPGNALHWKGVYKNWNGRCAECHATNFKKKYDLRKRVFSSEWSEPAVTCQACHGPGEAHIQWAEKPGLFDKSTYKNILNNGISHNVSIPKNYGEVEKCAACHSRRTPFSGNSPLPNSSFSDNYDLALLRSDLYHSDGQIKDEVYVFGSFLQSKMYKAGVGCTDCHNPHSGKMKANDNGLCTQCHSPSGNSRFTTLTKKNYDEPSHHFHQNQSEGAKCVSCHMPETTYMGVDARRDHQFGIPSPNNSLSFGTPNACTSCHFGKEPEWATNTIEKWYPDSNHEIRDYVRVFGKLKKQGPASVPMEEVISVAENPQNNPFIRASALEKLSFYVSDINWSTIAPTLSDDSPLVRVAAARLYGSAPPAVRINKLSQLLNDDVKAVRIVAARGFVNLPPQSLSVQNRANLGKALREMQMSLVANADHPNTQMALAGLALSFRNIQAANAAIKEALVLDPQLTDAWIMKARLEISQKRPDLVEQTMIQATKKLPNSPIIHHFFGNYLASQKRFPEALKSIEKAVSLAINDRTIYIDYARITGQSGDHLKVLKLAEELLVTKNNDVDVLFLKANAALNMNKQKTARATVIKLLMLEPAYPITEDMRTLIITK